MKYKTHLESRTLTRARLDAAVYALYLRLHDGEPRLLPAVKFLRQYKLGVELLDDLRTLGRVTSTGHGRGQRQLWSGAPPTPELVDGIEQLREARAARAAERKRLKEQAYSLTTKPSTAIPALPADVEKGTWKHLNFALSLTDDLNILLDIRNCVDERLRQLPPPTLFDSLA